jgi:GTP-binding protein|tara:strand:+ start:435 stop:1442 length:1008 start_codon:yes stop_codon:yes gene_type:complete
MKFIDHTTLSVKAGSGGKGCIAFLREKYRPKGGPSGGDGGHGGSIIFQVNKQLSTLQDITLNHLYRAENGANGGGKNMHGKKGKDIIIKIPPGTIIKNAETEQVLKDLTGEKDSYVAAKGGNGGFGNARFKTQRNTAPKIANDGQLGEELKIELELKVLADVGLVGFPNAGKSTFISKVSNAKPKIADYPFTTLVPNLGIVKYGNYRSFVMADIPGLIQGAADGKGLGSQFLRHIERTKVLVYLVECIDEEIYENFVTLKNELKRHNPELIKRPSLLLLTKTDLIPTELLELEKISKEIPIVQISSVSGQNLNEAIQAIAELIKSQTHDPEIPAD